MLDRHESERARRIDWIGSVEGARAVSRRAPTHRMRLLQAFDYVRGDGLTDQQAAQIAHLTQACYWKRCGELRRDELIEYDDRMRKGSSGVRRNVSVITEKGIGMLHGPGG